MSLRMNGVGLKIGKYTTKHKWIVTKRSAQDWAKESCTLENEKYT